MSIVDLITDFVAIGTVVSSLAVKCFGIPDQLMIIRRRKSVEGLSLRNEVLGFCAYSFWLLHGIVHADWVIIASQSLGVIMSGAVLTHFAIYRGSHRISRSVALH